MWRFQLPISQFLFCPALEGCPWCLLKANKYIIRLLSSAPDHVHAVPKDGIYQSASHLATYLLISPIPVWPRSCIVSRWVENGIYSDQGWERSKAGKIEWGVYTGNAGIFSWHCPDLKANLITTFPLFKQPHTPLVVGAPYIYNILLIVKGFH